MPIPDSPNPSLTVRLFGSLDVQVHGRPLPRTRSRKEGWLLALLALVTVWLPGRMSLELPASISTLVAGRLERPG